MISCDVSPVAMFYNNFITLYYSCFCPFEEAKHGNSSLPRKHGQGEDYGVIWIPVGAIVAGVGVAAAGALGVAALGAAALGTGVAVGVGTGIVAGTLAGNGGGGDGGGDGGGEFFGGGGGEFDNFDGDDRLVECDEVCNPECLADKTTAGKPLSLF